MSDLAEQIESSLAARRLFRRGQRILVAVSGGLDSMALLHLLHRLSRRHGWKLTVAHFNHQLRGPSSDADEQLVRQTAQKLKLPFVAARGDVQKFARSNGWSVEMAARKLRHDFLAAAASKLKCPVVALAHHADDQVELFFVRLLRGAGGEGLAGMKWSNPSPSAAKIRLARPLLDLPKQALRSFVKTNNLPFSEDATNSLLDIQRNRIRHELIPLLGRHYQPVLSRAVLRVMNVVGAETEFVTQTARQWLRGTRQPDFARLPIAVQRRIIHQQLIAGKLSPDFELIERLRLGAGQWSNVSVDCSVCRDANGLLQQRRLESFQFSPQKRKLSLSGARGQTTFTGLKIKWELVDTSGAAVAGKPANVEFFDADKVGRSVCLRCWQPGDRFQPIGTGSPRKLQDLFTNLKVPSGQRRRRVVAATRQGELFWVEGLRMAEKFKLDEHTVRKLRWSWHRNSGC